MIKKNFQKKTAKKTLKAFLWIGAIFGVERFCHTQTEGFQVYKIASDLVYHPEWEISPLNEEKQQQMDHILSQPFYFLGSGGQCYAFISEDKKTVIKFFKHHHMRQNSFWTRFSLPGSLDKFRLKRIECFENRLHHILGSCKIAYDRLQEETGLLYIHLNKTSGLLKKLTLVDKIGIAHLIDLDQTEFALQQTAHLAYPTIDHFMKTGEIDSAKECIHSLLLMIVSKCEKGVADNDPIIKRNFGFIGTKAVEIDIGPFSIDESLRKPYAIKKELYYETAKFRKWLKKHHPQLVSHFDEQISAHLL